MNKIKTGSGKRLLTEALIETALPVAYDAAAMPGASVLGNDGQVYTSIKIGESYEWSKAPSALSTGEIFLGVSEPRVNFNRNIASGGYSFAPAIQTEGAEESGASISVTRCVAGNGPSFLILAKVNNNNPLENTALVTSQNVGTILFMGADGTELIPGAAITATVSGTVGTRSVPMFLNFRTRPEGAVDGVSVTGRMRVMPDGNVLINNTTGTERLDVTGNIKASGSFIAGTNILSGIAQPRTNFIRNVPIGPITYSPAAQFEYLEKIDSSAPGETIPSLSVVSIGGPGRCVLGRANGSALGDSGAVSNSQPLAHYFAYGSDGTNLVAAARVRCVVDGTVSPGNVPGAFVIGTAITGSPDAISDHLRVTSTGNVLINNTTGTERLSVTGNAQLTDTANSYMVGANNVVGSRKTGWTAPTGTATRTTFDSSSVTTSQLAERVKALIDDLTSHGLIGT